MSSQLGFLTLSCALRLFNIHQKISVLRSNTWLTEDSAFLLIPKQRYCLVANKNGVSSEEEDDGTTTVGSANTSEWDCRMAKTRCSESNLDLMSCDRGSFSLSSLEKGSNFEISIPIGILLLGSFEKRTSRSTTAS